MFKSSVWLIAALLSLGPVSVAQAQEKSVPAATAPAATPPTAAPPVPKGLPADYFTRDPNMSPPQVSPDGTHLAFIEDNQLTIYNTVTESEKVLPGGSNKFGSATWISNDYLVVYMESEEAVDKRFLKTTAYSPLVVSKEAKFIRLLFAHDGNKLSISDMQPIIRFIDGPAPYAITYDWNNTNLIDVATGKRTVGSRLMKGEGHYFDHKGQERLAVEINDAKLSYGFTSLTFRYKRTPEAAGQTLNLPKKDKTYYVNFHYSEYDNSIYWTEFNYVAGQASIYRYDMMSSEKTLYKTGPNKDMDIAFDSYGRIAGMTTLTDRLRTEWTDPYYLKIIGAVQKAFSTATVEIVDMTEDRKHIVMLISAPDAPDSYYLYNADTKALVQVGMNYPELDDEDLSPMTYVTYKARDGLEIPAYITRRADTPPNAPLIVFPHGGPAMRDVYGFDYQAQFFASKGYVVLQPQYRGSGGFGDAFERAGNKHLDLMVTDMEDGVRFLQAQGMVDRSKVCIVGWSWGGYLAMAGLAFTPDTYACGISGDGVADLNESLTEDNDFYWGGYSIDYWRGVMGNEWLDAKLIRATSPIEHIDAIKAPLMLIHGELDQTVNVKQSEHMNGAMKKAGKAATYLPVKAMYHGPNDAAQRLLVLKAMDEFITAAFAKVPVKP